MVLVLSRGSFCPKDRRQAEGLLQLYREKGVTFVSLEDAEKDSFYKNDLDLSLPAMPDTLEQAMQARGLPLPARPHTDLDVNAVCR